MLPVVERPQPRAGETVDELTAVDAILDRRTLAIAHGAFFLTAGLWPVVHLRSFEFVTGPKVDGWLVKTVGTLIAVSGAVIINAARRDRVTPEIIALANGVSGALGFISFHYARKRRISRIYYLDAATELAIIGIWANALLRTPEHQRRRAG